MNIPNAYEKIYEGRIAEIDSLATHLRHKKTGARVFVLENSDDNKVFAIGFRTPAHDDCGTPHILEHSVLCGSGRFPLKDPFMELAKSSLNTFLNAMTFSDKTVYPVASRNDKDFKNLMGVYVDAVFDPLIYERPEIFMQEGWHYELEGKDAPLGVNGVVYSEMKGIYSSKEAWLARNMDLALFSDTSYAFDSGGDPDHIPELSYESFLDFHKRYYHPSNSYIYIYGDADMEERLEWMDREYLSKYDAAQPDSVLKARAPFSQPRRINVPYPEQDGADCSSKYWFTSAWSVARITDRITCRAFDVLEYVLIDSPGAILKKALNDAGIGNDIFGGWQCEGLMPIFSVTAKDAGHKMEAEFYSIVNDTLKNVVSSGIDKNYIRAAINNMEFRLKEADFGSYPKGLVYGLQCFDSWLYDEDPAMYLRYGEDIEFLRKMAEGDYFEGLIEKHLIKNPHRADIVMEPVIGLAEQKERDRQAVFDKKKAEMSAGDIEGLLRRQERLEEYQATPSTPAELATLPVLRLCDINPDIPRLFTEKDTICGRPLYMHPCFTGGILYIRLLFDISDFSDGDVCALALLRSLLCLTDTENYSYAELSNEINIYTGGLANAIAVFESAKSPDVFVPYFEMNAKVTDTNFAHALRLFDEVLYHSDFSDKGHIKDLINEFKSRTGVRLAEGGHTTAVSRAASYGSLKMRFLERVSGIDFLRYLEGLSRMGDAQLEELCQSMASLAKKIFVSSRMSIDITAGKKGMDVAYGLLPDFMDTMPSGDLFSGGNYNGQKNISHENEGFETTGQVVYVARAGSFEKSGMEYTGAMMVLRKILGSDYLWRNLREQGGAYGCMCGFSRNKTGYLVSYRDPNFERTNSVFEDAAHYVESLDTDADTLEKFIISTIGGMDRPLTAAAWGALSLTVELCGITDDMRRTERAQILSCSLADLKNLARAVRAILECNRLCVVGSASIIDGGRKLLGKVSPLIET